MRILQAGILKWVAMPSSRGSSQLRTEPRSPALLVDSLPSETPGKPKKKIQSMILYWENLYECFVYSLQCTLPSITMMFISLSRHRVEKTWTCWEQDHCFASFHGEGPRRNQVKSKLIFSPLSSRSLLVQVKRDPQSRADSWKDLITFTSSPPCA